MRPCLPSLSNVVSASSVYSSDDRYRGQYGVLFLMSDRSRRKREVNLKVLNVPEIEQKVLDATSDEPWGPHGSELSEIAQATKRFLDCDLAMNILWQRLNNTKANWRHLYKALVVIEYIIANGSERAVDDIYDNISHITALSRFECVEPNGKDVGLNVRKKSEAILSILDDREKLQQVREKAASTHDKYIGLSSIGMSYKSSSASFSSGNYKSSNRYGGTNGSKEADLFKINKTTNSFNGVERDQHTKENVRNRSQRSKSGIWADSLSHGLIDLDITESKKSSLAEEKYSALSQKQAARIK